MNLENSNLKERIGVLICGHGSRNRLAIKEFHKLAGILNSCLANIPLEYGFLEFSKPTLNDALAKLYSDKVDRVIALPAMLFAAGHAKNDIPSLLREFSFKSGLRIDYGKELGVNNLMIGAAAARLKESIDSHPAVPLSDTLLVVVGRGSSDPDANSNVYKITRMLVECFGFGWGETVYSGVTFPLVDPGLRHSVKLGFKRIIVFPYFLFSGVLVSRIRDQTKKVAKDHPSIEFINADYLADHPLVVETFLERFYDVLNGDNSMNCSLCKYRSNLIGFEGEVGLAQESHHHHHEGLGTSCNLCESECTGACEIVDPLNIVKKDTNHSHEHSHYPYPHSLHPFGPVSLPSHRQPES